MKATIKKIGSAFAIFAVISTTAFAQTMSVVDVGGTKFSVPIPKGYLGGPSAAPELHSIFSNMIPATTILKTSFLKAADIKRFFADGAADVDSYYGIMSLKKAEQTQATQAQFDKLRFGLADVQKNLTATMTPRLAEAFERVNKKDAIAPGVKLSIKPGEIVSLGVEENTPTGIIYTTLSTFTDLSEPNDAPYTMVTVSAVLYLKQKILMVALYKKFSTTKDVLQAKSELKKLTTAISASNP